MIITPKQYRENTKNCGVKTITGTVYDAHLFYANNRGRGKNNLTVCIVEKNTPRATCVKNQTGVIRSYQRASFRGISNINTQELEVLS